MLTGGAEYHNMRPFSSTNLSTISIIHLMVEYAWLLAGRVLRCDDPSVENFHLNASRSTTM
jgi:hypothetical protein